MEFRRVLFRSNRYSRLNVATKIRPQVAMPACRVLLTSSGCRVKIAAIPPPNAYTAHTNAKTSAKEPNTSMATPLLPRRFRVRYMLLRWGELAAAPPLPPPNFTCFFTVVLLPGHQSSARYDSIILKKVVYLLRVPFVFLPTASLCPCPIGQSPGGPASASLNRATEFPDAELSNLTASKTTGQPSSNAKSLSRIGPSA